MRKFLVASAIALSVMLSGATQACVLFPDSPEEIFRNYASVFLARPLSISPDAEEIARLPTGAPYRQTVIWQVVKVWKGDLSAGETFLDTQLYAPGEPCSGTGIFWSDEAQIFSLVDGSQWYRHSGLPASRAAQDFDALALHDRNHSPGN